MPVTQKDHWIYTVDEWTRDPYTQLLNALPFTLKVVYDIGANVGGWARVMQDRYDNKLEMHCFEPVQANYDMLCEQMPDAHNHKWGIFYGATESKVMSRGGTNCGAYFVEQIDAGEPRYEHDEVIELRPLEGQGLPHPDLVKLDIEGSEENVMAHSTMLKKVKWIIVEWHPNTDARAFFKEHLPNHGIVLNVATNQYLLCLR